MKKRIPFLLCSAILISTAVYSQGWKSMMEDPSVNFYSVQQSFEQYWSDPSRAVYVEVPGPVTQTKSASAPGHAPLIMKQKLPGWKAFKRWEDFMRPRVYPTGDRSVMISAMNDYYEDFYSSQSSGQSRGMSGGPTPNTLAANWSIIGPTTSIPTGGGGAGRVNFVRFDPATTNTIWVGSPGGGLWKSTTGGTSWTTNTDNLAVIGCTDVAIHPTNNQVMYLATGDGDASDTYSVGVLKSTNGGTTWSPTGLNWLVTNGRVISRLLMNPVNPNTIFAATSNGVYRTINAGANWTQIATAAANIKDIEYKPGDTTVVYAASTTRFYRSANGGTTFTNITSGLPANTVVGRLSIAVTAANPAYVYVLGSLASDDGFQGLYRSTDSGLNFTTRATTPNILGWSNTGSDAGGQGWYDLALAASPTNADIVIVGGVNIWRSTNGGTNWTINAHWTGSGAPYVHADCHALEFIPGSSTTYFAGCDGGLFKTTNSGTAWSDLSNGLQIAQIYRIGLSATNANLLLTGWQDNGTNRWSGTTTWSRPLGGDGMEAAIDWSNANVQYGELYYGEINRTTTGGNLTTTIVQSGGTGVNADGDWVTPYILNPQKASTMIVGKAQAYRSRNRGTAWTALGTVTGGTGNICALAYAPTDSNYLYMAKINKFYASVNSGTSFVDRTGTLPVASAAITYITVASNNPAHVWVTFSGYSAANKVWYSPDAGVTWTNYSTGLPNIPANCIVYQNSSPTDVLYVGTDVGVYTRDNSSAAWTAYNTGLPNVSVRELEIHYGASKLRAATFGRGVWQSDLATPGTSPPVADFSANRTNICAGDCINFTDLSSGAPTGWSWTFTGAVTTSSTLQNPTNICYNTPGTYNVTLTATNTNGSNPITKTGYIVVSGTSALPLAEGFQGPYLPAGWYQTNADTDVTWAQSTAVGGFGTSTSSVAMDNYSPAASIVGTIDEIITPKYSFASVTSAQLTFDVAYARYNGTYTDSLIVYISTNCGVTWTPVYNKGGYTGLQTAPDNATSMFVPTNTQWRTETVNLSSYAGQANVTLKFTSRSGWGQMLYLDNINLTGAGSPTASVSIAQTTGTNPICAGALAVFTATPVNGGTTPSYQWKVNGANVGTNSATYSTSTLTSGQVVTCQMTSNLPGVTGSPATSNAITMTVNALPATPAPASNSPVCSGTPINLSTAAVSGATYSWSGPASFTSALQNPSLASATSAMAGTYSLTVTAGGCTSVAGTVAVTVNSTPAAPAVTASSPVCAGSAISLSTPAITGATYSWTGPASFTSAVQNPTRPSATAAMAGTYSLTITVGGCASAAGTAVVVVNAVPATPAVTASSPVCEGSVITLSTPAVAGAVYAWSGPASFTSAVQNPTRPAATAAMAGTYSVTVTSGGCTSAAGTANVIVNPTPAAPAAANNGPVCSGSALNLTTGTITGATYSWSGPLSFTSALQNPSLTSATAAMSGTYSLTITVGGCTSAAGTTVATVNQTPATPVVTTNSPLCSGATINLSTPAVTGAAYSWTGPGSFTSTAQNPARAGATVAMSGTYSVTVATNGCSSPAGTATVTVNATPTAPIANINGSTTPAAVCAGGTITLTSNSIAGAVYSWTGPNSYSASVRNPPALTNATSAMAGTYSLSVTVNGCQSNISTVSIGVTPIPSTPTASSNTPVCTGTSINLSTPAVVGAGYSWTGPSFTSALQNPTRPSATAAMAGTYSVTVTVSGCTSLAGTTVVAVNSTVTPGVSVVQTGGTNPLCAGSNVVFTATPANGGTSPVYQWQVNGSNVGSNSTTYSSSQLANGQVVTCTMTSSSGCASPASVTSTGITMTVNPVPSAPVAGSNAPVCAGTSINFTASTVAGASYSWSGPGSFSSTLQNPSRSPATAAMAGTYSVTVTASGCTSPAGTTTVTVNPGVTPAITITQTSGSNPMCAGSAASFTAVATNGGSSPAYQWLLNGSNAGTGISYSNSALTDADIISCVLTSNATCASPATIASNAITMTVNPVVIPSLTVSIASGSNPMCNGQPITFQASGNNGGNSPAYQWQVNGVNAGSNAAVYSSSTLADGDVVSCTMTSGAVCASPAAATSAGITMSVGTNVTPSVMISVSPSNIICAGDPVTFSSSVNNEGGSPVYQWQVNSVAAGSNSPAFSSSALNNGDVVTCTLTSSLLCATPSAAASNSIGMMVNPVPPAPAITQSGSVLSSSAASGNQWYLNGSPIAGATGQNYTFLANGNYTVIVTVNGCSSVSSAVTSVTTVGISEGAAANEFMVYPNPNNGEFSLSFFSNEKADYRIEIMNALGQKVYSETLNDFTGSYIRQLTVTEFGQGIYTIGITNSKSETVKKMIVY